MRRGNQKLLASLLGIACVLSLSACKDSFEGSGSKDAASAEQLALRLEDPWDRPVSKVGTLSGSYVDGTYTGIGQGMDGWIEVTIEIKDNKLDVISMRQEGETQSVGGFEAIRDGVYAEQINKAQGSDIEGVSGATITSIGVKQAVDACLEQAKAN